MSPSRPLLASIVGVGLVWALLWMRTGERMPRAELEGAGSTSTSTTAAPSTQAAEARPVSTRSAGGAGPTEGAEGRTELGPASAPVLELRFVSKAGTAIGGVGFELHVEGDRAQGRRGPRWSSSADESGVAALAVVAGRKLSVWVPDTELHGQGELEIAALAPGQRASRTIELASGLDRVWYVRVEAGGRPIGGARVVALEQDGQGARVAVEETASDPTGLASLRCRSWREREVLVQARGIGLALVTVTDGHARPADALVVSLWPSATLRARVLDGTGQPAAGVLVAAVVGASRLGPPSEAAASYEPYRVEALSDASGLALLEEVPAGLSFELRIAREGVLLVSEPGESPLPAGESVERRYVVGVEGALLVRVLDPGGAPLEGVEVVAARASRYGGFPVVLDPERDARRAAMRVRTDAEGRAALEGLPLGSWNVGALPAESDVEPLAELTRASIAPFVELTVEEPVAVLELRLAPALAIAGRLIDEAGAGLGGIRLQAFGQEVGCSRSARSDSEGAFRLAPLPAGPFSLHFDLDRRPWIAPRLERIAAGTLDLEIVLRRGGALSGMVLDAVTGAAAQDAIVSAFAPAGDRPFVARARCHAREGAFELVGLDEGAHVLLAETVDGRIGLLADLRVQPPALTQGLELRVTQGVPVRVRRASHGEPCDVLVTQLGVRISYAAYEPGQVESFLAPPGPLEISVERAGRAPERLQRVAVPGEQLEIVLE